MKWCGIFFHIFIFYESVMGVKGRQYYRDIFCVSAQSCHLFSVINKLNRYRNTFNYTVENSPRVFTSDFKIRGTGNQL